MKRFAPKAIAISLATAFAIAAPVVGSVVAQAPAAEPQQAATLGTPAALRDQKYRELVDFLARQEAAQQARRAEIAAELRAADPALTDDAVALRADQLHTAELRRAEQERWDALANQTLGRPHTDLPGIFARAVRGCTTDGYIFRMPYNLTYNMDEIAAPSAAGTPPQQRSMFYRMVRPDPESLLGVTGTGNFMDALKAMNESIDSAMQTVGGRLIDEVSSEFITRPIFQELANYAIQNISNDIKARYGVTVTIHTEAPRQQGQARCPVVDSRPVASDAPLVPVPPPAR